MKRKVIVIFCLLFVFLFSNIVFAENFNDTDKHWAKDKIEKWAEKGLIKGYDSSFMPDNTITRAQMAKIIDTLMNLQYKSEKYFSDLDDNWYTDSVLKVHQSQIMLGSGDNIRPNDYITREEAVVVFARAFGIESTEGETEFNDNNMISSWAKGYVKSFAEKGYIKGVGDNSFDPKGYINRASVVNLIDSIVAEWITEPGEYSDNYKGIVIINTGGTTIRDSSISSNLIIAEGVGEGNVNFDNVVVKGTMIVKGGGEHSIFGDALSVGKLVIDKAKGAVRVVADNASRIYNTIVRSGATLYESTPNINSGFQEINIEGYGSSEEDIKLLGHIKSLKTHYEAINKEAEEEAKKNRQKISIIRGALIEKLEASSNIQIENNGAINSLKVRDGVNNLVFEGEGEIGNVDVTAEQVEIEIKEEVTITEMNVEASDAKVDCVGTIKKVKVSENGSDFELSGTGSVGKVDVKANGANIETKGTSITVASGVKGTTSGEAEISAGKTTKSEGKATTGDTTITKPKKDSNHTPTVVNATGINITNESSRIEAGSTTQLNAEVTPSNAINKTITWQSSDESIATVSENGLVSGVASGTATITATTVNDITDTYEIAVYLPVATGVNITADKSSIEIGNTVQLNAKVTPNNAVDKTLVWESSDKSILTVTENGLVAGLARGTAIVTATTVNDISNTFTIIVGDPIIGVVSVTGDEVFDGTLTATYSGSVDTLTLNYKWYRISETGSETVIEGATSNTYSIIVDDIDQTLSVKVSSTDYDGEIIDTTETISKADVEKPTGITVSERTLSSITLNEIDGAVYSIDGVNYVSSPVFTGLTEDAEYTIYIKLEETATHNESPATKFATKTASNTPAVGTKVKLEGSEWIVPSDQSTGTHIGIWTVEGLEAVRSDLAGDYVQMADIDLSEIANFTPIGTSYSELFDGSFDGNSFTISNLTQNFSDKEYVGLFGCVRGSLNNIALDNVDITGTEKVGALVGFMTSSMNDITNCNATGSVTANNTDADNICAGGLIGLAYSIGNRSVKNSGASVTVNATGENEVSAGGLVGYSNGVNIMGCYATGNVSGTTNSTSKSSAVGGLVGTTFSRPIRNSYATGNVTGLGTPSISPFLTAGGSYVGGILGKGENQNYDKVIDCYAIGDVVSEYIGGGIVGSGAEIKNSYALGDVMAGIKSGGLLGTSSSRYVLNSIGFNENVSGVYDSDTSTYTCDPNRIAFSVSNGYIKKDYAYSSMAVNGSTVSDEASNPENTLNGKGITADIFNDESFYTTEADWEVDSSRAFPFTITIWDFTPDTATDGENADDDGYYWKIKNERPVLYYLDGDTHKQIGNDDGDISFVD